MKARYWSMSVILGGLIVAGTAWAALDCGVKPTCAELGYTDTADKCDDSGMLKCPFDETAVFCRGKTAAAVTGRDCEIGSVLYSDLNCYNPDAAPSGLTAVGVVFDTDDRLAVAFDYNDDLNSSYGGTSFQCCDYEGGECVEDGRLQTNVILEMYKKEFDGMRKEFEEFPFGYCLAKTDGLPAGSWFLPSVQQLLKLCQNKNKLIHVALPTGFFQTSTPSCDYSAVDVFLSLCSVKEHVGVTADAICITSY